MNGRLFARLYLAILASFCWCYTASLLYGDNGSVVTSSIVSGITVDADLSDWPDDARWHSMDLNLYGDPENNEADFTAHFRVGVDPTELKLFVAFRTRDESYVPEPKGYRSWKSNDSADLHFAPPVFSRVSEASDVALLPIEFEKFAGNYDEATQTHSFEYSLDLRKADFSD